ncbi:hypothetical protein KIPE111705_24660 [Kibdelosporangium persicum]|uniref:hypothetical protein n=1 Tax=Kibdelosporangium persicum TaxID=2698649 RepID=UPI001C26C208|nr:hypothetical protein [Kibdelosporangium persicum]
MTDLDGTFAEAQRLLAGLVTGEVSPQQAANWAMPKYADDQAGYHTHDKLWTALDRLAGADLHQAPGVYLHGSDDFRAWLAEAQA